MDSELSGANLSANGLVEFPALFTEFRAQKAVNENVGRGIDGQKYVANADSDMRPQRKWILSGILTFHRIP